MKIVAYLRFILAIFIIGVVIGMVSSAFHGSKEPFLIPYLTIPYEEEVNVQEQVDILEEEMEVIGSYKMGAFMSVWKIHDNKDNLTCWVYNRGGQGGGGISCIPDHLLTP